jgi:hypothetical protein
MQNNKRRPRSRLHQDYAPVRSMDKSNACAWIETYMLKQQAIARRHQAARCCCTELQ